MSLVTPEQLSIKVSPAPIPQSERIRTIDFIRGIAIFGILLINIAAFSFPDNIHYFAKTLYPDLMNQSINWIMKILIEGKFYSIFSFLFGLGMAVQYERFKSKDIQFSTYFRRRLFVLLGIGLLHDIFLWPGMILIDYALLGFLLLAFQNRKQKTIIIWIISIFVIPLILGIGITATQEFFKSNAKQEALDKKQQERQIEFDRQIEKYQTGTYLEQFRDRISRLTNTLGTLIGLGWYLLGMFLIGIWSWRKGIFKDIEKHKILIKKGLWLGFVGGILSNGFYLLLKLSAGENPSFWIKLFSALSSIIYGNLTFSIFYICTFILIFHKMRNSKFIEALISVGKTALSNYIFQTIICTTLFYSYGFGLYGKTSPSQNLLIVIGLFSIQLILSYWWMKRFRFGPLEWVWRSLTYKKIQTIRIANYNNEH